MPCGGWAHVCLYFFIIDFCWKNAYQSFGRFIDDNAKINSRLNSFGQVFECFWLVNLKQTHRTRFSISMACHGNTDFFMEQPHKIDHFQLHEATCSVCDSHPLVFFPPSHLLRLWCLVVALPDPLPFLKAKSNTWTPRKDETPTRSRVDAKSAWLQPSPTVKWSLKRTAWGEWMRVKWNYFKGFSDFVDP